MNSCLWILLLLGCCGNNCNNWFTWENNCCDNGMYRRGCNDNCSCNNNWRNNDCGCDNNWKDNDYGCGGNLIQPRVTNDCGCEHHHHNHNWNNECDEDNRFGQNNIYMTPPPMPGRVRNDDCDCGCNN